MEGIWYTHFTAGPVQGDGLAVLNNGEIQGGDPSHTYVGSYQEDGPNLYANVRVTPFAGAKVPVEMEHPVTFFLKGSVKGNNATVTGHPNNRPDMMVCVEMQRGQ